MSTRTSSGIGQGISTIDLRDTTRAASITSHLPLTLTLEEAGDEILSNPPYVTCPYCSGEGGLQIHDETVICDKCGGYGYAHTLRHLAACVALDMAPAPLPVSKVLQTIRDRNNFRSIMPNWKQNKRSQWGKPPSNIAMGALLPPKDK